MNIKSIVKYNLVNKAGTCEYVLIVKTVKTVKTVGEFSDKEVHYTLKTSNNGVWSDHYRNIKLVKAIDTGDGVIIKGIDFNLENNVEYDYGCFSYLCILLDSIRKIDGKIMDKYKLIKQ